MKLDEFRKALESDATKRADSQEQTIKELHAQILMLSAELALKTKIVDKLQKQNGCKPTAFMCIFCRDRATCTKGLDKDEE